MIIREAGYGNISLVASLISLFMNILLPLIEKMFIRKPFGYIKEEQGGKK